MIFRLSRAYIEYIHDEIVAERMPGNEPIDPRGFRDRDKIEAAVSRPFQTAFEQEIHRSIFQKAAALFHSLVCTHAFFNGNKRTALMALDMFLTANGEFLLLNNDDAYELAKATATHNADGASVDSILNYISSTVELSSISIDTLGRPDFQTQAPRAILLYRRSIAEQFAIRSHPLNQAQPQYEDSSREPHQ